MQVNLEGYILLNLALNLLMLFGCARIAALRPRPYRPILAALLGVLYAILAYLPHLAMLQTLPVRLLVPLLMLLCAFAPLPPPKFIRCYVFFFGVTFLFGGTGFGLFYLLGFNRVPVWVTLASALICVFLSGVWMRYERRNSLSPVLYPLTLTHNGHTVTITALLDTGLRLTDPVYGLPVIVVPLNALTDLIGDNALRIAAGLTPRGMRPLRYRSVGGNGIVWAFEPDEIRLDDTPCPQALCAVVTAELTSDGAYRGLIPQALCGATRVIKGGTQNVHL